MALSERNRLGSDFAPSKESQSSLTLVTPTASLNTRDDPEKCLHAWTPGRTDRRATRCHCAPSLLIQKVGWDRLSCAVDRRADSAERSRPLRPPRASQWLNSADGRYTALPVRLPRRDAARFPPRYSLCASRSVLRPLRHATARRVWFGLPYRLALFCSDWCAARAAGRASGSLPRLATLASLASKPPRRAGLAQPPCAAMSAFCFPATEQCSVVSPALSDIECNRPIVTVRQRCEPPLDSLLGSSPDGMEVLFTSYRAALELVSAVSNTVR